MIPGIHEVQSLATKYSKAQLSHMAQIGMIDPTKAVMAGMMIDRIAKQNMEAPQSTVAQDVMAPPAPQAPQMGMQQPPQGQPQEQPQQAPSAGVSGIPAPNMERMAGGGIVAFGDGGDVPGYAGDEGSLVSSSPLGRWWNEVRTPDPVVMGNYQAEQAKFARERELQQRLNELGGTFGLQQQTPAQRAEYEQVKNELIATHNGKPPAKIPAVSSAYPDESTRGSAASTTQAPTFKDARTNPTPEAKPGLTQPRSPVSSAPAASAPATGLGSLTSQMQDINKASGYGDLMSSIKGLRTDAEAANKRAEELASKRPDFVPYEKYKADLDKEAAGTEDKKSENVKMAIINAGLAMMSGKSQYALQNIGEGAQVGTKQYAEGVKELAKADKERQKALAEIEQAQNLYKEGKYNRAEDRAATGEARLFEASKTAISATASLVGTNTTNLTHLATTEANNRSQAATHAADRASQERQTGAHIAGTLEAAKIGAANKGFNEEDVLKMAIQNLATTGNLKPTVAEVHAEKANVRAMAANPGASLIQFSPAEQSAYNYYMNMGKK